MPTITKQSPVKSKSKKPSGDILDEIEDVSFDDDFVKLGLYGEPGSGKTTIWATFPRPILSIICSGNTHSGKRKPGELRSLGPEQREGVKTVVPRTTEQWVRLARNVEPMGFKTVVVDHVTSLQDLILAEILGLEALPEQKSWGMASQQDYGQCTNQMKEIMRPFLDVPAHVVFIGQQRTFKKDEETDDLGLPSIGMAVSPSMAGWLHYACDYLVQAYKRPLFKSVTKSVGGKSTTIQQRVPGKVEYCLRTGPSELYTTKFRVPKGSPLPESIVDPDFETIKKIIDGKWKS